MVDKHHIVVQLEQTHHAVRILARVATKLLTQLVILD